MNSISVKNYDFVEDAILEFLFRNGINVYKGFETIEKGVVYVCGAINIVQVGDTPNTLKHQNHNGEWGTDIEITDSYRYATYYVLDELNNLCETHLTGEGFANV